MEARLERKEQEIKVMQDIKTESELTNDKLRKKLEETHRAMAKEAARRNRDRLAADSVRLGKLVTVRQSATSFGEIWEKGYAFHELARQREEILKRREELELRKKELARLKRSAKKGTANDDEMIGDATEFDLEIAAEQQAIATHTERLKRDEHALDEKERMLHAERGSHEKELRRVQCEDRSRFYRELDLPLLGSGRYSLLKLLGQGGFSEVWLALDLIKLEEVAVKIHQLNHTWSEERKQAFTRHAIRELEIQGGMSHPRVVKLIDTFEIDNHSFATVLEYCRGTDLDEMLKKHKVLDEKVAKSILLQLCSGLRYLSSDGSQMDSQPMPPRMGNGVLKKRSIIHFDLKPANILFDEMGDVKITDFGLSKVFDEANEGTSMELTSQGAGTYWYLPPECFPRPGEPTAKISSKVDVWSVGVIYYQILYGRRPFGEGRSQQSIFQEGTILNARQGPDFQPASDARPNRVSEEAREFIRGCLTYDQNLRWDVSQMCQSAYLRSNK